MVSMLQKANFPDGGAPLSTYHAAPRALARPAISSKLLSRVVKESSDSGVELKQAAEPVATPDGTALGT